MRKRNLCRPVTDGLDVVAVWIQDKGAVVLRVVVGAQAGWAVVAASGGQPGSMERLHGGPIGAGDGDMGWPAQRPVGVDPEVRLAVATQARRAVAFHQQLVAERTQRLLVKRLALFQIADPGQRGQSPAAPLVAGLALWLASI